MAFPANPNERSPKGDHNRRLSLGLDADEFAATAGVSIDELKHYEFADTEEIYDASVAARVGEALERLEANIEPKVANGPAPEPDDIGARIHATLQSEELGPRLALADVDTARRVLAGELSAVDPTLG
jgi:transcriptional regulator with XRE-family HTH domain